MIEIILIFIFLLFAHYIGDFGLQNQFMADNKYLSHHIMFAHCMIYTGIISSVLYYFGFFTPYYFGIILGSHFMIDTWKGIEIKIGEYPIDVLFHVDQLLHVLILLVVICLILL